MFFGLSSEMPGARGACGACKSACTEIRKAATFQRVRVLPNCRCEREAKMLMVMIIGNTIGEVISRSFWRELLSPFGVAIIYRVIVTCSICDDDDEAGTDNQIVERFYFVFISFFNVFILFLFRFLLSPANSRHSQGKVLVSEGGFL